MTATITETSSSTNFDLGPGPDAGSDGQAWRAVLAMVGVPTSDGRIFDELGWRDLPLSLLWQPSNEPGHDGAVVVGRIDRIQRDGAEVWGYGVFDSGSADAREVVRQIRGRFLRGVSVDAAALDVELADDGLMHFRGEIGAATIVAFPAFADAEIELLDAQAASASGMLVGEAGPELVDVRTVDRGVGVGLVAASGAGALPRSWFDQPVMTRREPLHVTAEGRVWGHIAGWGECHTGNPNACTQPPRSKHSYAYFLSGHVLCDDGSEVPTGPIVLAADHAALRGITWVQAKDHYANSALAAADITCGEDEYGIWVAGGVRPGTPPEMVHALRACPPSGDWRPIGGALELIAVLAVNTPGFPALAAAFDGDDMLALVASGGLVDGDCGCGGHDERLSAILAILTPVAEHFAAEQARERAERARFLADALALTPAQRLARADELAGMLASDASDV